MRDLAKVYVERRVEDTWMTRRVLDRLPDSTPVETVEDADALLKSRQATPHTVTQGKRELLLAGFSGQAIKPCPATPRYRCCLYQILNYATGCPFDCTYCILQGYFSNPLMTLQADVDTFLHAARAHLAEHAGEFFRLGTGEFADSLALEPLTGYARVLVDFMRDQPNAILEVKSKAAHIDGLLDADHRDHTICAWSMNAPGVVSREELGATSIEERLEAARKVRRAGYRVAFHFDPIVPHDGWGEGYANTIRRIFETVDPEGIAWISLGCFRYTPGLEEMIRARFPARKLTYGEFVLGEDGKMRYPQPLRIQIYQHLVTCIRDAGGPDVFLYFCMENARVWNAVMGYAPRDNEELRHWLDEKARPR